MQELNGFDLDSILNKLTLFSIDTLERIISTRVPIHVATIESSNIFPLQNGKNIYEQITSWTESSKNDDTLIEHIVSLINFGSYEKILTDFKDKLKVIAIVGRQSGGKSYLLNRLTGSRFNVASTRCTDGIWMSLAYLDNQLFVVCDCEGLFSTRRNDLEETKLCLTLCAVCDVLILNQDLSFNRYLAQLFNNFAKSCDRLTGRNLFKGILMILIRDVASQDADGAYIEMISNIKQNSAQSKNAYLEKLFNGRIKGQCLHNFENEIFTDEIDELRSWLMNDVKSKWTNGFEFLETFKFVMAQVHTDDDTYLDMRRFRKVINQKEREAIIMFMTGGNDGFADCEPLKINLNKSLNGFTHIIIKQNEINFTNFTEKEQEDQFLMFIKLLSNLINLNYNKEYHNEWYQALHVFTTEIIENRKNYVLKYVTETITFDSTFEAEIENFKLILKNKLDALLQNSYLCQRKCRLCERICVLKVDHKDDCNCETDHLCEKKCELCSEDRVAVCCQKYGHEETVHKCNEGHVCGFKCEVSAECTFTCNLSVNHSPISEKHNCKNAHRCNEKCLVDHCSATCAFDLEKDHENHICGLNTCDAKCSFEGCKKFCKYPDHTHDQLIKSFDSSKHHGEHKNNDMLSHHICSEEHSCSSKCEADGACTIGFNVIEKVWTNECNSFPYKYYEPVEHRDKCIVKIPLNAKSHHDSVHHDCKKGSEHRCHYRCPECKSFCRLPVNHEQIYHDTNAHRNKECNVFVSKSAETIKVKSEGLSREYEIGESCKPEICSDSCERRGRGHFHLIECPGEDSCPAKFSSYVKHSKESWHPYTKKTFDMWQCEQYWHSLGWEPPVNDEVLHMNRGCSFYCGHPDHDESYSFCKKTAWHTDCHEFECVHSTFDTLELMFCCDTTGSMGSYIVQSKSTIRRIIEELSAKIKNISIGFVVSESVKFRNKYFISNYYFCK